MNSFPHLLRNSVIEETMNGSTRWPSVQSLLKLAKKTYLDFNNNDKWVYDKVPFFLPVKVNWNQIVGIVERKVTLCVIVRLNAILRPFPKLDMSSKKNLLKSAVQKRRTMTNPMIIIRTKKLAQDMFQFAMFLMLSIWF